LLIVRDLAAGPRRFVELQRVLPGISTEQLRSRLNRMVADGMLTRKRYREVPPRVDYELTERARDLMPILGELARWGFEWAWSMPRPQERVDIGAIFRVAPGLAQADGVEGTVELSVHSAGDENDTTDFYSLIVSRGSVRIAEHASDSPQAKVSGTTSAWIEALAPGGDRSELLITGDASLASALLNGLAPQMLGDSAEHAATG
jgi:DNA-binding HxlR family transcriptional regulator